MTREPFEPGLRISGFDAAILLTGGAVGGWLYPEMPIAAILTWFVVGHFFLFCNVFRIARHLELTWTGIFLLSALPTISWGLPGWPACLSLALLTTVFVVACEMRKPSYHGLGWQKINPNLRQWWDSQPHETGTKP